MSCKNEFGIIDEFDTEKDYSAYEPHNYNCISVDDDIINGLINPLTNMKTYFHSYNRPENGLDHWGVTLIPPESLSMFYDITVSSKHYKRSEELNNLAVLIIKAMEEKKYIIHYGV